MSYESPMTDLHVTKNEDIFVDDTGCGCNGYSNDKTSVLQQAQFNAQKHNDYVETTGGFIATEKSHYYHVKWILENGFQIPHEDSKKTSEIYITQGGNIRKLIRKLDMREEHKTLGCWVNPLGIQ